MSDCLVILLFLCKISHAALTLFVLLQSYKLVCGYIGLLQTLRPKLRDWCCGHACLYKSLGLIIY